MQKHSILGAWRASEYACVQIAPGNVLCHYNKHLMGYFEFLHGSRIICLPLNISENFHWQHTLEKLRKRQRLIVFIFINMIKYPCTLKNNIYYSNQWGPPPFFHADINPVLGHVLVHSVDKTHVLVVKVELIWLLLNMLSLNFVPTPNKSPRFTRFRRSCVNHPAVVRTNHDQSYPAFLQSNVFS